MRAEEEAQSLKTRIEFILGATKTGSTSSTRNSISATLTRRGKRSTVIRPGRSATIILWGATTLAPAAEW